MTQFTKLLVLLVLYVADVCVLKFGGWNNGNRKILLFAIVDVVTKAAMLKWYDYCASRSNNSLLCIGLICHALITQDNPYQRLSIGFVFPRYDCVNVKIYTLFHRRRLLTIKCHHSYFLVRIIVLNVVNIFEIWFSWCPHTCWLVSQFKSGKFRSVSNRFFWAESLLQIVKFQILLLSDSSRLCKCVMSDYCLFFH